MTVESEILEIQLKNDTFYHEDSKVSGIAKLAVDKGYETLSSAQKAVLAPFLIQTCEGVTDPGDHHNGCSAELTGQALLDAYEGQIQHDSLLCGHCRDEDDEIEAHRERFMRD